MYPLTVVATTPLQELIKAKQNAAETVAAPTLLAAEADKARKKRGKWFEEQESTAAAAADPYPYPYP